MFIGEWIILLTWTICVSVSTQSSNLPKSVLDYEKDEDSVVAGRRLTGRHVCTRNKVVMKPVKELQSYCKATKQSYLRRCEEGNELYCTGYRIVYEMAFRQAERMVAKTESTFNCCPGWTKSRGSPGDCRRALCSNNCKNGGSCLKPERCLCPQGWTGASCETKLKASSTVDRQSSMKNISLEFHVLKRKVNRLEQHMSAMLDFRSQIENITLALKAKRVKELEVEGKATKEEDTNTIEDRINSLSEQISILEEKLADCSCTQKYSILRKPRR